MRVHALDFIYSKWSCHVQSLDKNIPKCLCKLTSSIGCWFITMLGWFGLLRFLENITDSDLDGLNVTSHLVAH